MHRLCMLCTQSSTQIIMCIATFFCQNNMEVCHFKSVFFCVLACSALMQHFCVCILHVYRFAFPNCLVVYMTVVYALQSKRSFLSYIYSALISIYLLVDIFYIITFFDRGALYCSSKNLYSTFSHVTPFCVISGNTVPCPVAIRKEN